MKETSGPYIFLICTIPVLITNEKLAGQHSNISDLKSRQKQPFKQFHIPIKICSLKVIFFFNSKLQLNEAVVNENVGGLMKPLQSDGLKQGKFTTADD